MNVSIKFSSFGCMKCCPAADVEMLVEPAKFAAVPNVVAVEVVIVIPAADPDPKLVAVAETTVVVVACC